MAYAALRIRCFLTSIEPHFTGHFLSIRWLFNRLIHFLLLFRRYVIIIFKNHRHYMSLSAISIQFTFLSPNFLSFILILFSYPRLSLRRGFLSCNFPIKVVYISCFTHTRYILRLSYPLRFVVIKSTSKCI
jgi:hypothetical protein